ncbi:MAG: zinc transporter ZupT [Victivallales bacterium]|nr:zinc transporter ZupT [Victivallales bacterium]
MIDNYSDVALLSAFGLTLLAGAATGIGSGIAFFAKRTNTTFLSVALGFSAGVMIYVSFSEIMVKANQALAADIASAATAKLVTVAAFFGGMGLVAMIDRLVPSVENPHEMHNVEELTVAERRHHKLMRMGLMSALAIGIHNFPEGLATFIAGLKSPSLGLSIAVAIAIHNIPEGIAVSVPVYYATGSRKKAFLYSFLSGLAEPLGALIGYFLLLRYLNDLMFGLVFAAVAGIMVFISFDELLPAAEKYGEHHLTIYGLVGGMALMAGSLLLFM